MAALTRERGSHGLRRAIVLRMWMDGGRSRRGSSAVGRLGSREPRKVSLGAPRPWRNRRASKPRLALRSLSRRGAGCGRSSLHAALDRRAGILGPRVRTRAGFRNSSRWTDDEVLEAFNQRFLPDGAAALRTTMATWSVAVASRAAVAGCVRLTVTARCDGNVTSARHQPTRMTPTRAPRTAAAARALPSMLAVQRRRAHHTPP
jgi:hypothetical protein